MHLNTKLFEIQVGGFIHSPCQAEQVILTKCQTELSITQFLSAMEENLPRKVVSLISLK